MQDVKYPTRCQNHDDKSNGFTCYYKRGRLGIVPPVVRSEPLCRCVITCVGFEELALFKAAAILFSSVSIPPEILFASK